MTRDNHLRNIQHPYQPIQYILRNTIISEQILSYCIGRIIYAWQKRRSMPFVIANSVLLNAHNDIPFTHNHTQLSTTHNTTYTHNWIRAHTYIVLIHLHTWILAFHHDTPSSIRLLRIWLNTYAKSWHTCDATILSRIPNILNTNRYQVNIMPINTGNGIMQIVSFDSECTSSPHHTACLDLLDPTGLPWHHSYDISGRPQSETEHPLTQGIPALTFSLPMPNQAFKAICSTIVTPIAHLPHNRQRMIVVVVDCIFNRTHFVIAGEYLGIPQASRMPNHYGYGILHTLRARRGYNSHHMRTEDCQADLFLTFPFARHTHNDIPTFFDELLLSYQHRPVLTHQDILGDNYSNTNIRKAELLVQCRDTPHMSSPPRTHSHQI